MIFKILLYFLLLLCVINCTYDKITPKPLVADCDTTNVTYSLIVKPIIEKNCYECHSTSATNPERNTYLFFDDFNKLKEQATSTSVVDANYTTLQAAIRHIGSIKMPQSRPQLSECDMRKIEIWIKQGAPQN